MSRLNIQNDLFLGLQELQRQSKFYKEDGYIRLFRSIVNDFGVVDVNVDSSFNNFRVEGGTNSGTIKIAVDSFAIDDEINIIVQRTIDNVPVIDDSLWYWVKISYQENNLEEGTINLAANGDITGIGTEFSAVLRDQSNYPVKVNFPGSALNTGDYQVVSILSDTQAILSGTVGFTNENGLDYKVVGSFTPGINPAGDDRLPYFYDSCNIELILEIVPLSPPAKVDGKEFYIARVRNVSGAMTIQDKRAEILSIAKTNSGWVQPVLGDGFTNEAGREVQYRKNYLGEIEVRGSFITTSGTATLFTLPEEFRPPYTIQGIYGYNDGSVVRIITVDENGVVVASGSFAFSTSDTNEIISLRYKTI